MFSSRGKKGCSIGKSCGATCIQASKWCIMEFGPSMSKPLSLLFKSISSRVPGDTSPSFWVREGFSPTEAQRKADMAKKGQFSGIKSKAGSASVDTAAARVSAAEFDAKFKVGKQVPGSAKSVNWEDTAKKGTPLGEGAFGSVIKVPGKPDFVVKRGETSVNEARIIGLVGEKDIGPKLIYGELAKGSRWKSENMDYTYGRIAMTMVPGKDYVWFDDHTDKVGKTTVGDAFWALRSKLHKMGIAHNDAHTGNVIIDEKGKARFVDLGLAQEIPKAALSEALGVFASKKFLPVRPRMGQTGDYQVREGYSAKVYGVSDLNANSGASSSAPRNLLAMANNLPRVFNRMKEMGLSDQEITNVVATPLRRPARTYEADEWGKISNKDAAELINLLYDGVKDFS